jgi:hypothetical protein
MFKFFLSLIVLLCSISLLHAQKPILKNTKKPLVKKSKGALSSFAIPLIIKAQKGDSFAYLNKGSKLLYEVSQAGNSYNFMVTINGYDYNNGIHFNYEFPNSTKKGNVYIDTAAMHNATKYVNRFDGSDYVLKDAASVWLSSKSFSDMVTKKTILQFDNEEAEIFFMPEENEANIKIIYKNKEIEVAGFAITNSDKGFGEKNLWIHDLSANPLILYMNFNGWIVKLKEIK